MESLSTLNQPRGFTLAEMIVVLAIIGIITSVVVSSQGDFNRTLVVTDTAYSIALSIRQAQTFGLSSRTAGSAANVGYGVHFDSASPGSYVLFSDTSKATYPTPPSGCTIGTPGKPDSRPSSNCRYDVAGEVVQTFTFGRGFTVTQFCGHDSSSFRCSTGGDLTGLDIVFSRPNTNSIVTARTAANPSVELKDAQIKVSAPTGGDRYVCVTKVGQIYVSKTACP